jgi:hypothetical protein
VSAKRKSKRSTRRSGKSTSAAQTTAPREALQPQSVVGDLVNFRGLVYSPINETGVVFLFGKVAADLNMYVEEIKPGFPDCIARRFTGKGWERVAVEFEFKSSHFYQHGHDPRGCDIIVCWEHDWPTCPLEVIELRDRIKEMPNEDVGRPGEKPTEPQGDIAEWFKKHRVGPKVVAMFDRLWDHIRKQNDEAFYKVGEKTVGFFSPERTFARLFRRKTKMRMNVFTGGRKLGKVRQLEFERGAEKWGTLAISSEAELKAALPWISESMKRVRAAVRKNEPTGWYATTETGEDEE